MKPRPYQAAAAAAIFSEFRSVNSTLVVMPTGCGKTILFANVIHHMFPRRALVLAHRQELIFQAKDKIQRMTGLDCGIEMGDYRLETGTDDMFGGPPVVISSIQTQGSGGDGGGRMTKFLPGDF
ncbi:MAG: DEAD/DEAH box helicase family protein, partial [Victivallaceae bacterium]|nr:DEAD/DEAH box helicase family protein [Victivallaceae bacterium]